MSKFFSAKFSALTPYTPGEQPKDAQYVKLNTNESPFSLPASVADAVKNEAAKLQLYSDPESTALTELNLTLRAIFLSVTSATEQCIR